jgi:hypothetical protein
MKECRNRIKYFHFLHNGIFLNFHFLIIMHLLSRMSLISITKIDYTLHQRTCKIDSFQDYDEQDVNCRSTRKTLV